MPCCTMSVTSQAQNSHVAVLMYCSISVSPDSQHALDLPEHVVIKRMCVSQGTTPLDLASLYLKQVLTELPLSRTCGVEAHRTGTILQRLTDPSFVIQDSVRSKRCYELDCAADGS